MEERKREELKKKVPTRDVTVSMDTEGFLEVNLKEYGEHPAVTASARIARVLIV